jgi:putative phosphoribosyl transferase
MSNVLEQENEVVIPAGRVRLGGNLDVPERAQGIVLFAHGSGSSRHSPRNRFVASALRAGGLATLLLDLLSEEEEAIDLQTTRLRFDIAFLAERVLQAMDWLGKTPATSELNVGLFGSSTGAGAALVAAAERPELVKAVVSRGGRPDLAAAAALGKVRAPTLLIVGGNDEIVIELNKQAMEQMSAETKLEIVPHATHLFEEPGALEKVSRLATQWFQTHLETK